MEQPQIIATRYKKYSWVLVTLTILCIILYFSVGLPMYRSGETSVFLFCFITLLILFLIFISVYLILVPKTAITKEGENLVIHEVFRKKVIPLDAIEYVSFEEIGTYRTRDWELDDFIIVKNDIRPLWIFYQKDGAKEKACVSCESATAAAMAIETLLERRRKNADK